MLYAMLVSRAAGYGVAGKHGESGKVRLWTHTLRQMEKSTLPRGHVILRNASGVSNMHTSIDAAAPNTD